MRKSKLWILVLVLGICGCGGGSGGSPPAGAGAPSLDSIVVVPGDRTLAAQAVLQLSATGNYADGSHSDITRTVTWVSSAPAVAAVDTSGKVTAGTAGTAAITAKLGTVTSQPVLLTVNAAVPTLTAVTIDPPVANLPVGTAERFTATATYSDGTRSDVTGSATWTATAPVVTLGGTGQATAEAPGTATISASFQGITGGASVTVTPAALMALSLDPPAQTIALGTTCGFTATGLYSDGSSRELTREVSWQASDPAVAAAETGSGAEGNFTSTSVGSVLVTATLQGVQGTAALTVSPARLVSLSLTPEHPSLPLGTSVALTAVGTFSDGSTQPMGSVTWLSSNADVVGVSNAGTATSHGIGTATVSASVGSVRGNTTLTVTPAYLVRVAVTPADQALPLGTSRQFTATGTYSDGSVRDVTAAATWTSSAPTVAGVGNAAGVAGKVSALAVGVGTITATVPVTIPAPGAVVATTGVTVTPATLISLALNPIDFTLPLGTTRTLMATGTYSDGTTQDLSRSVTWSSSAPDVAQVSNASGTVGKVTPLTTGGATITASLGGKSTVATVTVTPLDIMNLRGTWVGSYTIYDDPGNPAELGTYSFTLVLGQSGSTVTASPTLRGAIEGNGSLVGAVSGDQFRFSFTYTSPSNGLLMTDTGLAHVVGDTMTGDVVENFLLGYNCSYHFTLTRQQ
ncbi:Ig-like domain-containing protein [Geomesophilobacter sediminis]|uniref:Ig-like domain-containing protein n=1 Tax=Geomesophilobacter sediminis TaxID=2798584 RepID=A0A8J7M378_9BACT|nr:Ig-like domain-containing protein [Geomesophilobacter sediminis]MBJ6727719.1 Ig-like domain-containing protein [Geomesophilobacter sediminis]